jgi:hypothetical protein
MSRVSYASYASYALAFVALSACAVSSAEAPSPGPMDGGSGSHFPAEPDASARRVDGGLVLPDGTELRADRFITKVVRFTPGACAGFGSTSMPAIVLGPPTGAGTMKGSLDVVSLGIGGEIVVSFEPNAIVDGPGADFLVFENAFYASGNATQPAADPGEVSVSEDGETWLTFPCSEKASAPYGTCAGWRPVLSSVENGISPVDADAAGGDPFDLAALGMKRARFVRIRDRSSGTCEGRPRPDNLGFDLDAIAIVHAETP